MIDPFDPAEIERSHANWQRDTIRDRNLSNKQIAREISDLAKDGHNIHGTIVGLLNRLRPPAPVAGDLETPIEDLVARAISLARGEDPDEIIFTIEGDEPEVCGPRWSLHWPAARAAVAVMSPARRIDLEALIQAVARTIVGPRKAVHASCRWSLAELQTIQWDRADPERRQDAEAAARAIVVAHVMPLIDLTSASPRDPAR